MTETTQHPQPQSSAGAETDAVDEQLAARVVAQARSQGISLVGPDGLLQRITKLVLEGGGCPEFRGTSVAAPIIIRPLPPPPDPRTDR